MASIEPSIELERQYEIDRLEFDDEDIQPSVELIPTENAADTDDLPVESNTEELSLEEEIENEENVTEEKDDVKGKTKKPRVSRTTRKQKGITEEAKNAAYAKYKREGSIEQLLEQSSAKMKRKSVLAMANKIRETASKLSRGIRDSVFTADVIVQNEHQISKMQTVSPEDEDEDYELVIAQPFGQKPKPLREINDDILQESLIRTSKKTAEQPSQEEEQVTEVHSETFPEPIEPTMAPATFEDPLQPTLDFTQAPILPTQDELSVELGQQPSLSQEIEQTFQEPIPPTMDVMEEEEEEEPVEELTEEELAEQQREEDEAEQLKREMRERRIELIKEMMAQDNKGFGKGSYLDDECVEGEEDDEGNFIETKTKDDEEKPETPKEVEYMADFLAFEGEEIEHTPAPAEEENDFEDFDSSDDEEEDDNLIVFDNDSDDEIIDDRAMDGSALQEAPKRVKKQAVQQDQKKLLANVLEQTKKTGFTFLSKRAAENLKLIQQQFNLGVEKENAPKSVTATEDEREKRYEAAEKRNEKKLLQNFKELKTRQRAQQRAQAIMASQDTNSQDSFCMLSSEDSFSYSQSFTQSMSFSNNSISHSFSSSQDRPLKRKRDDARGSFIRAKAQFTEAQHSKIKRMAQQQNSGAEELRPSANRSATLSFGKSPVAATKKTPTKKTPTKTSSTGKKKATPKKDEVEPARKRKKTTK